MENIGIEDQLRKRIMRTYRETRNTVRVRDRKTKDFWTERGVRRGCPISPTLFSIYIINLEEEMRKEQTE